MIPGYIIEPETIMQADNIAGEIHQIVNTGITGRNVHTVNAGYPSRKGESGNVPHDKIIMSKKFIVILAV
jgi:hypothetical protein